MDRPNATAVQKIDSSGDCRCDTERLLSWDMLARAIREHAWTQPTLDERIDLNAFADLLDGFAALERQQAGCCRE